MDEHEKLAVRRFWITKKRPTKNKAEKIYSLTIDALVKTIEMAKEKDPSTIKPSGVGIRTAT